MGVVWYFLRCAGFLARLLMRLGLYATGEHICLDFSWQRRPEGDCLRCRRGLHGG